MPIVYKTWSSLIFGNYHYTQKLVETTEQLLHILDDTHLESSMASFSEIGIQEAKSDDVKPSENISESLKHPIRLQKTRAQEHTTFSASFGAMSQMTTP